MNQFIDNVASMYYDFVKGYGFHHQYSKDTTPNGHRVIEVMKMIYTDTPMYYVLFPSNKEKSVQEIKTMLKTKNGTINLMSALDHTILGNFDNYIFQIEELDYLTKNMISTEQLSLMVKKKFEFDDEFHKKNYFKLYLLYRSLSEKIFKYYKSAF